MISLPSARLPPSLPPPFPSVSGGGGLGGGGGGGGEGEGRPESGKKAVTFQTNLPQFVLEGIPEDLLDTSQDKDDEDQDDDGFDQEFVNLRQKTTRLCKRPVSGLTGSISRPSSSRPISSSVLGIPSEHGVKTKLGSDQRRHNLASSTTTIIPGTRNYHSSSRPASSRVTTRPTSGISDFSTIASTVDSSFYLSPSSATGTFISASQVTDLSAQNLATAKYMQSLQDTLDVELATSNAKDLPIGHKSRLDCFSQTWDAFIAHYKGYAPLHTILKGEYDAHIARIQCQLRDVSAQQESMVVHRFKLAQERDHLNDVHHEEVCGLHAEVAHLKGEMDRTQEDREAFVREIGDLHGKWKEEVSRRKVMTEKARTLLQFIAAKDEYHLDELPSTLAFSETEDKYLALIGERLANKQRATYPHWEGIRAELEDAGDRTSDPLEQEAANEARRMMRAFDMETCTAVISSLLRGYSREKVERLSQQQKAEKLQIQLNALIAVTEKEASDVKSEETHHTGLGKSTPYPHLRVAGVIPNRQLTYLECLDIVSGVWTLYKKKTSVSLSRHFWEWTGKNDRSGIRERGMTTYAFHHSPLHESPDKYPLLWAFQRVLIGEQHPFLLWQMEVFVDFVRGVLVKLDRESNRGTVRKMIHIDRMLDVLSDVFPGEGEFLPIKKTLDDTMVTGPLIVYDALFDDHRLGEDGVTLESSPFLRALRRFVLQQRSSYLDAVGRELSYIPHAMLTKMEVGRTLQRVDPTKRAAVRSSWVERAWRGTMSTHRGHSIGPVSKASSSHKSGDQSASSPNSTTAATVSKERVLVHLQAGYLYKGPDSFGIF